MSSADEGSAERSDGWVAQRWLGLQAAIEDACHRPWNRPRRRPDIDGLGLARQPTGQCFEGGHAQPVLIRGRSRVTSRPNLGGDVAGGAGGVGLGRRRVADAAEVARRFLALRLQPGKPEVCDAPPPVGTDEDVSGGDVAMDQPDRVRRLEPPRGIEDELEDRLGRALPLGEPVP